MQRRTFIQSHLPQFLILGIAVVLPLKAWAADVAESHPLHPLLLHAYEAKKAMNRINDYEAMFTKREMVNGKMLTTQMQLKLRERPFSVYTRFVNPHAGREIIFVEGRNNNLMRAHEGSGLASLVGTISLPIDGPDARKENRYPINMVGMTNLIDKIVEQWEYEGQFGEIEVKQYPQAKLGNLNCIALESSHPQPRKQFRYQMTRLYIDKDSKLPVRVEQYEFPAQPGTAPVLVEEYTYTNIRVNLQFSDADFDENNPNYKF